MEENGQISSKMKQIYTLAEQDEKKPPANSRFASKCKSLSFWRSFLPPTVWLPAYSLRTNLGADVIAGLTVGFMSLPQGMGYALLANLRAVNGLYISCFPLPVYALLGTSRHLSIGALAIVSLLT